MRGIFENDERAKGHHRIEMFPLPFPPRHRDNDGALLSSLRTRYHDRNAEALWPLASATDD